MIMFKYDTKANIANNKGKSLRTTIPKEIVKILDISAGDSIEWNVDVINNDTYQITITKKED